MSYHNIDEVLSDRRQGTTLSEVVENILRSPYVLGQIETPFDVISDFQKGDYLDASTETWGKLSAEKQAFYASAYQRWYADKFGLIDISDTLDLSSFVHISVPPDEGPPLLHTVLIPPMRYNCLEEFYDKTNPRLVRQAYWMSETEITKEIWRWVMGEDRYGSPLYEFEKDLPEDFVSWDECQIFCKRTGTTLPSDTLWEMACRAGTTSDYFFGNDVRLLNSYAWYSWNSRDQHHDVRSKKENPFGLYDMYGNVWELCQNRLGHAKRPIIRGGCIISGTVECQSGHWETIYSSDLKAYNVGFRVVKKVTLQDKAYRVL